MELNKAVYILWPPKGQTRERRKEILLNECSPKLIEAGAKRLIINIADQESKMRSPAPKLNFAPVPRAMISIWIEKIESRYPLEEIIRSAGFKIAGYFVEESIYTEYGGNQHAFPRDWPDGERSPGILIVTMMKRPQRYTRTEWIKRWHGTMSPVSEEIQPRTRYVRNLVLQTLTPDAPPYEGIVSEAWPSKKHISNPFLFYGAGNPLMLIKNMLRILKAVKGFLDLSKIQTVPMSEYFIKTGFKPKK